MGYVLCAALGAAMQLFQVFLLSRAIRRGPGPALAGIMVLKMALWAAALVGLALIRLGWTVAFALGAGVTAIACAVAQRRRGGGSDA